MGASKRKILLVDDSKAYQEIFKAAFSDTDLQLLLSNSGAEALALLEHTHIDLICSAYHLQDMEAIALCEQVRKLTNFSYKPFFLLTSVDAQNALKKALPVGVTDIFHKRDVEQLIAYIKRIPYLHAEVEGRVLYVEDTRAQRTVLTAMLEAHGLTVDAYASVEEAWPHFLANEYDVILTDIVLKGTTSGLSLVNQIRRFPGSRGDTPILAITAFDDRTRRIELFNLGVTDYIIKPVEDEELIVRISSQIARKPSAPSRSGRYCNSRLPEKQTDNLPPHHHQLLATIEQAFAQRQFALYYQPKVNIRHGTVVGAEALIRWLHPELGLLLPCDFLPTVENTAFEIELGNWVIDSALAQLNAWQQSGLDIQVSINISPRHLQWSGFYNKLHDALAAYPHTLSNRLEIEVLESSVIEDLNAICTTIQAVKDGLGVCVALDDFGTGYSSLTHLRHLSAHTIKIDRGFIRDMLDDPSDFSIVEGVFSLANAFGRKVVAEGVETSEHGQMLLIMGCQIAQGYGIAHPMPPDRLPKWIYSYQQDPSWELLAKKTITPQTAFLHLLEIENNQWLKRIYACVQAEPSAMPPWPVMNHERCLSGRWLAKAGRDQLYSENLLKQIEQMHVELHRIGNTLMHWYLSGQIAEARAGLEHLQSAQALLSEICLEQLSAA